MEIRLLGTVEIGHNGTPLPVRGERERTLLGALGLRAGAVVERDLLVDALWEGTSPPRNASNALQATVSRLRRELVAVHPQLVVRRGDGYLCTVEPDEVDALRFQGLLGAASGQRAERAAALLDDALALWRGRALTDADPHGWLHDEVDRLTELRVLAAEDRMAALLDSGAGADLVADLEQLVASHPLRERLRAQLMTALYRGGRQAEALALFERTRQLLAEELGVDPSEELRQLHRAILTHDAELTRPGRSREPILRSRHTGTLPPRTTSFVGRRQELRELRELLEEHRLVTVIGPGGIGKSSLALAAAGEHCAARQIPAWSADLGPVREPARVVGAIRAAMGIRTDGAGESNIDPVQQLTGHLSGQPALLVLDNCGHLAEAVAALAHRLMVSCPDLGLLVTSREVLAVPGEVVWGAPPMRLHSDPTRRTAQDPAEHPDAVALFLARAHEADPRFSPTAADLRVVREICERLDGLPLAIELAAARVRALSLEELTARLQDRLRLLDAGARVAVPRHRTLRAAIDWSYDLLSQPEARLFTRLSVFHSPWTVTDAEAICADEGLPRDDVLPLLLRLVDRSMVAREPEGRFRLLDTLRVYATERVEAGSRFPLRRRHAAYFLTICEQLRDAPNDRQLHARVQAATEDVNAAIDWAVTAGEDDLALRFAGALGWLWATFHIAEGRRRLAQLVPRLDSAPSLTRGWALQSVAYVESYMPTPMTKQHAMESAVLLDSLGEPCGAARSRIMTAFIEMMLAGDPELVANLTAAGELASAACEDGWARALAALMRFRLHLHEGQPVTALAHGREALARFRTLDDPWGVPWTSIWLAVALRTTGHLEEARSLLDPTLADLPAVSYPTSLALQELGTVLALQGDADAATVHGRALAVARRCGVPILTGFARVAAGFSARSRGDHASALEHYLTALTVFEDAGFVAGAAHARCGVGLTQLAEGDPTSAETSLLDASVVASRAGRLDVLVAAAEGLALRRAPTDPSGAARLLGAATAVRRRTGITFTALGTDERDRAASLLERQLSPRHQAAARAEGERLELTDLLHREP